MVSSLLNKNLLKKNSQWPQTNFYIYLL